MSSSRSLASGLSLFLTLGAACAPSSSPGRAPRAGADSAPENTQESRADMSFPTPDPVTEPAPDVAPQAALPAPPIAAKPGYLPRPAGPYKVRVVDESHHDLPRFASGGRAYVMGTIGSRYSIVVTNPTARRVEVVLSVDGLDAMDGQPANYAEKRGYILPAYGEATIDGFRTSLDDVATFRFSSVADSYAGRLGQARDVGVIGVAFFAEQAPVAVWQPPPQPTDAARSRPAPSRAAPAPKSDDLADESASPLVGDGAGAAGGSQAAPSSPAAERSSAPKRRGLGTEFGEERTSRVVTTAFERANPSHPSQIVSIRYNDRAGLIALGIIVPPPITAAEADLRLRETADPFRANRFAQPPP